MDVRRNLIIVKGEDKTAQIRQCQYNPSSNQYAVTFDGGKTYHYAASSIRWLKCPEILDPALYCISSNETTYRDVQAMYVFHGDEDWWRLFLSNGYVLTHPAKHLNIQQSCLSQREAQNKLSYLQRIAGISELRNQKGEVLLRKQYDQVGFVDCQSALALYLDPEHHQVKTYAPDTLIFPFGGNASQFRAVEHALTKQMSVIQGPPGTGKTQTILNIIANLLIRQKTMQVVSNNNAATQNVLEKLCSPRYGLGFLVAALGKQENKQSFIAGQTGIYPDMSSWQKDFDEQLELAERIAISARELRTCFQQQERLAIAKRELQELRLEQQYFTQYLQEIQCPHPRKSHRRRTKSATIMHILQAYERCMAQGHPLSQWQKFKGAWIHGLFEYKFYKNSLSDLIAWLQALIYQTRSTELEAEIQSLQKELSYVDAKEKMRQLTVDSLAYLKSVLFQRYGRRTYRQKFDEDTLWRKPASILAEYPIVLSTTFSSCSCLRDVSYDYLIMDEASQVDIATGALALSTAKSAVIVGDLRQLPNVITEDIRKQSEAIFASYHLPEGYNYANNSFLKSVCAVIPNLPQVLLREHYRCHPKIINFCNQMFYQNQLVIMSEDHGEPDTLCVYRTNEGAHRRGHINQRQIDVTIQEVLPGFAQINPAEIGIIAPYRDQARAFSTVLQHTGIEVDTVHKFQGREKDAVIITTVDDEVTDFSDDPFLLNVAISRAKKKLCLVVSGNAQPEDSNIRQLVAYIEYNNFQIVDSAIYSVFDLLYQQYTSERIAFLKKHPTVSAYHSENLMYATIVELLKQLPDLPLQVICHQQARQLIRNVQALSKEEYAYICHPNTHVDFLIYNQITKAPVLAIEVDGFHFHKDGTRQADRDKMKDAVFARYGIPLLRLPTNGSGEIQKIKAILIKQQSG